IYRDAASCSSVGKNGAPGSECRWKSPDNTPHLGHVLAKYFCPIVFENCSLNVGTRPWMYARMASGSSVIPDRMQISPAVPSTCGARMATTGILAPHRQHEYIFPIKYNGGSIVSRSSSIGLVYNAAYVVCLI